MKNLSYEAVVEGTKSMNILGGVFAVFLVISIVFFFFQLVSFGINLQKNSPKADKASYLFTYGTLTLVLIAGGMVIGLNMMQGNVEDEKIKPYINSIETKRNEITNIKISDENKVKETEFLYTKEKPTEKLPVSITLKNGDFKSLAGKYQISKTLKPGEKPYVEYQELKKPIRYFTFISHKHLNNQFSGFDKGLYNVKVFVPKDYKLDF